MRRAAGALLALALAGLAAAQAPVPELRARVTDTTALLTAEQRDALEARLAAFEQSKGSQVGVLIVPSTTPETLEQYGIRVAEQWRLGRRGVDDGAILIVALQDRALRIEVGYGLEGALPDAVAKRIIEETILPRFRAGEVYGGIHDGVEQMLAVIGGEPLPEPDRSVRGPGGTDWSTWLFPVVIAWMFLGRLSRVIGRVPTAGVLGGLGGVVAYVVSASLGIALLIAVMGFVFGLGSGVGGRRRGLLYGGLGGFGRGGGFGGGFRGGGGGFGGGGASGRW